MRGWVMAGTMLAAGLVASCGVPEAANEAEPAKAETAAGPEFRTLPGMGNHAMIIPEGVDPALLPGAAKERCGAEPMCTVYGWTDAAEAATALPLTEPEAASLAFQYSVNRNSGFERALWDCERWPREDAADCLA